MPSPAPLDPFFNPKAVAVVGASARESSVGHALLRNLLYGQMRGEAQREAGFPGPVYAVNPKGGEILGQPVYPSIEALPGPIDLALVAIPAPHVLGVIEAAAAAGATGVIVISAGFAELGEEGLALQAAAARRARELGLRLIGPNCLGVLRPSARLNASFAGAPPPPGGVGLLSQSGALVTGIISYAEQERFGLSAAASLGAKADVSDVELLDWLAADPETQAIALYAESFPAPREAFEALRRAAAAKPVVAIKGGSSEAGAKAASSHTGALAGSAAAYSAAFAQAGVIEAHTISDFMAWSRTFAAQPPAAGDRVAILTNAGGPGVLSADYSARAGLRLAELSADTRAALDEVLPSVWSHGNPVDIIGDAGPDRYRDALNILGRAPEVDGVVVIMTVQAMTQPGAVARAIAEAHQDPSWRKPMVASFLGLVGTETGTYLDRHGVPEFNVPERAVAAMGALARRGRWLARAPLAPTPIPAHPAPDDARVQAALDAAAAKGQRNLDLSLAREVLEGAGLRYNRSGAARSEDEAVALAESIGFPIALKVISPDVIHKSDVGGVILDLVDAEGVRAACAKIRADVERHQPGARVEGFTVEEQVKGTEIIVGMSRDPGFGPVLMVGMGGIFVEVYKDVAFRLVPLERADAAEMIDAIQAQPLLDGARGRPKLDRAELCELLVRVSELVERFPQIQELDLNPLVLTERGLVAIDARVIAGPSGEAPDAA